MKISFIKFTLCLMSLYMVAGQPAYSMDYDNNKKRVNDRESLKINRTFLGLDDTSSNEEYVGCLTRLLHALDTQRHLNLATKELIDLEQKLQQASCEAEKYYQDYYEKLLNSPELSEEEKWVLNEYFKDHNNYKEGESIPTPIIPVTPLGRAITLMCRNLIESKRLPQKTVYIISKFKNDENKDVRFIANYLAYKMQIDDLCDQSNKSSINWVNIFCQIKDKLCNFTSTCIRQLFKTSCKLIEENEKMYNFSQRFKTLMSQKNSERIHQQYQEKQIEIVNLYDSKSDFFDALIQTIHENITKQKEQELLHLAQNIPKKKKKTKIVECKKLLNIPSSNPPSHNSVENSHITKESNKTPESPSSSSYIDKHFIPDFCLSKKSHKSSDGYVDGAVLEKESSEVIIVIDDPDNKMKISLYAVNEPGARLIKNKLGIYPLNYKENVDSWFTCSEQALKKNQNKLEKEFTNQEKLEALRIHRFSRHVDRFIFERGIEQKTESWINHGQKDLCITIPGHVEYYEEKKPKTCIFVYLIDSKTGQCYHRNIEFKSDYAITHELIKEGSYKINIPLEYALRKKNK